MASSWWPCCCDTDDCPGCSTAPAQLDVELSGWLNLNCSPCSTLDGTYRLDEIDHADLPTPWDNDPYDGECHWIIELTDVSTTWACSGLSSPAYMDVMVRKVGSLTNLEVHVQVYADAFRTNGVSNAIYLKNVGTGAVACDSWSAESCAYSSGYNSLLACDPRSSTAEVTAV